MKPYYQDNHCTIYHGDCREILPTLEPVDLVLTDPPYGVNFKDASWGDDPNDYPGFMRSWIDVSRTAKFAVFQATKNICRFHEWFPDRYRVFAACRAPITRWNGSFMQMQWDAVVIWGPFTQQHTKFYDYFEQRLAEWGANRDPKSHPCARPYDTVRYLVHGLSAEKETILDPFMGSGTTLRAAKDLNRKAIGIEIEEKYCEVAVRRLRQEVLPLVG